MKMKYKCRLKVIFAEEKLKDKSFTQKKFAKKIGITDTTLSQIVNGKSLPTFDVLYKVLTELKRPISDIWEVQEEKDESIN
jgi:putative transcriptional regulator